jgi:predicted HicB family RNase H-like nuclease
MKEADPNRQITYPLRWPAWMAEKTAQEANARAQSMATWIREAVRQRLEREGNPS